METKDNRTVLIGQAPGNPEDARNQEGLDGPLGGRAAENLSKYAGWENTEDFMSLFERDNILRKYSGSAEGKGDLFPEEEAREKAPERLREYWGRTILAVGKKPAELLLEEMVDYYERSVRNSFPGKSEKDGFTEIYCIPHPSGINRHWNDENNVERFENFLKDGLGLEELL